MGHYDELLYDEVESKTETQVVKIESKSQIEELTDTIAELIKVIDKQQSQIDALINKIEETK